MLRAARDRPDAEMVSRLEPIETRVRGCDDARVGALTFAEKRPPTWTGR